MNILHVQIYLNENIKAHYQDDDFALNLNNIISKCGSSWKDVYKNE